MTLAAFKPIGATGPEPADFFYGMEITGPDGARYRLLREKHHTPDDVRRAKAYLRNHFDVVSIDVKTQTYNNAVSI